MSGRKQLLEGRQILSVILDLPCGCDEYQPLIVHVVKMVKMVRRSTSVVLHCRDCVLRAVALDQDRVQLYPPHAQLLHGLQQVGFELPQLQ